MSVNVKEEKIKNVLLEFIRDESKTQININDYCIFKRKYKNNQFLYCQSPSYDELPTLKSAYCYVGFYNMVANKFFDLSYPINYTKTESLNSEFEDKIIDKIKIRVADYLRNNSDTYFKGCTSELNEFQKLALEEDLGNRAKAHFFRGIEPQDISDFICLNFYNYEKTSEKIKNMNADEFFLYIENPEKLISHYTEEFLKKRVNSLYREFQSYEIYIRKYKEFENDKDNIIHKQKAIKDALIGKKTATVIIFKNGQKFAFKTDTKAFNWFNEKYSIRDINAQDREKYISLFGRDSYMFDEILKITYSKKEIYNKGQYKQ